MIAKVNKIQTNISKQLFFNIVLESWQIVSFMSHFYGNWIRSVGSFL